MLMQDPKETPAPLKIESREERLERKKREKAEQAAYKLEQGIALCKCLSLCLCLCMQSLASIVMPQSS